MEMLQYAPVSMHSNTSKHFWDGLNQQYLFEHTVLIDPADYDRIYNLGVTVSIQPAHALVGIYGEQADHWQEDELIVHGTFQRWKLANLPIVLGNRLACANGRWVYQLVNSNKWSTNKKPSLETVFKGYNLGTCHFGSELCWIIHRTRS